MKRLLSIFITVLLASCSLDNKTGLWKDASNTPVDKQDTTSINDSKPNQQYENLFIEKKTYNEEKKSLNPSNIKIDKPLKIIHWLEQYAVSTNNISNFFYTGNNKLLSRSKKLSNFTANKNYSNRNIVFYKNNLISYDHKGTIFTYSLDVKKKISQYNFYKKNFKNYEKKIYFIINKNILYVADNLGYLYALNLNDNRIIWAKNYGIPFRSNLKFVDNQILLANQDNVIYSIDANTGDKNWQYATSTTFLKSDFENNLALDLKNKNVFFLNTNGELYSINYSTQKFNWFKKFKAASQTGDTELFLSQPIVIKNNNLIISTKKSLLNYDVITSEKKWNLTAEPNFKPIVTSGHTYVILKNNLLLCLENSTGNVIWSKNIFRNIEEKKIEKKFKLVIDFKIVNNQINIYSKNGYLLSFNSKNGKLNYLSRISKNGINSKIFFLNDNMFFVNNSNKLLKFN